MCVLLTVVSARDGDLQALGDRAFPSEGAAARPVAVFLRKRCFQTVNELVIRHREMLGEEDSKESLSDSIRVKGPQPQFHDGKSEAQIRRWGSMSVGQLK